jgi:alpha-tubulin suppressor-like RCC1 family protein
VCPLFDVSLAVLTDLQVQLSAGDWHSAALDDDGALFTWGSDKCVGVCASACMILARARVCARRFGQCGHGHDLKPRDNGALVCTHTNLVFVINTIAQNHH